MKNSTQKASELKLNNQLNKYMFIALGLMVTFIVVGTIIFEK